jgi:hypothetical protein
LIFLGLLDLDGEGKTVLRRNFRRYLPKDRASSRHVIGVLDEVMFVLIEWQQLAFARFAGLASVVAFVLSILLCQSVRRFKTLMQLLVLFTITTLTQFRRKSTRGVVSQFAVRNLQSISISSLLFQLMHFTAL